MSVSILDGFDFASAGIDDFGVVQAGPSLTYDAYTRAIARGVPPQLQYLVRNAACRRGFDDILPGARAVVCCVVAMPPWPDGEDEPRYARFCTLGDYHQTLRQRLSPLAEYLKSCGATHTRICVDTAPVLERELAVRAGLGSIGWNRMFIHPRWGSFVALGEVFADIEVVEKRALEGAIEACTPGRTGCPCASGTRCCVRACPTQALTESGYDMHRCLAYWSTQHRGEMPEFYARSMGSTLWGCDRCQNACPRNRSQSPTTATPLDSPLPGISFYDLLTLSGRQLKKALAGSPLADAHPDIVRRNACIVLGNLGAHNHTAELENLALHSPTDWVRSSAQRALG